MKFAIALMDTHENEFYHFQNLSEQAESPTGAVLRFVAQNQTKLFGESNGNYVPFVEGVSATTTVEELVEELSTWDFIASIIEIK